MVNNHGDRKSPKDGVVGPLPNGLNKWLIHGGHKLVTNWDDPPSTPPRNSMPYDQGL